MKSLTNKPSRPTQPSPVQAMGAASMSNAEAVDWDGIVESYRLLGPVGTMPRTLAGPKSKNLRS